MQSSAEGLTLSVPAAAPDPVSSTIVLKVKGALDIEQAGLAQDYDGSVVLPASEARLHGKRHQIRNRPSARQPRFLDQPRRLGRLGVQGHPARQVRGHCRSRRARKGLPRGLRRRQHRPAAPPPPPATTASSRSQSSASLEIAAPGKVTLAVRPVKDGWHPVNLKAIRLKPVAAASERAASAKARK